MTIPRSIFTVAVALLTGGLALGYPKDYGPFQKAETPQSVELSDCPLIRCEYKSDDITNYPSILFFAAGPDGTGTIVRAERIISTNDCYWWISVLDAKGTPISGLATNEMSSYIYRVQCADLNGDGKADFLVNIWSGGCGLAGEGSTTTFLLSSEMRYVPVNWHSFDFGPEDIVRFSNGGPCYFICNDLIGNGDEKTKDGRDHNFWVYELYRYDGRQMVLANADDPRFPKWVWYTFKENHKETDQLTKDQKQRILGNR